MRHGACRGGAMAGTSFLRHKMADTNPFMAEKEREDTNPYVFITLSM